MLVLPQCPDGRRPPREIDLTRLLRGPSPSRLTLDLGRNPHGRKLLVQRLADGRVNPRKGKRRECAVPIGVKADRRPHESQ